jgi:hypothetical protein
MAQRPFGTRSQLETIFVDKFRDPDPALHNGLMAQVHTFGREKGETLSAFQGRMEKLYHQLRAGGYTQIYEIIIIYMSRGIPLLPNIERMYHQSEAFLDPHPDLYSWAILDHHHVVKGSFWERFRCDSQDGLKAAQARTSSPSARYLGMSFTSLSKSSS